MKKCVARGEWITGDTAQWWGYVCFDVRWKKCTMPDANKWYKKGMKLHNILFGNLVSQSALQNELNLTTHHNLADIEGRDIFAKTHRLRFVSGLGLKFIFKK